MSQAQRQIDTRASGHRQRCGHPVRRRLRHPAGAALPHAHLGIIVGVYFLVMLGVMAAANYLVSAQRLSPTARARPHDGEHQPPRAGPAAARRADARSRLPHRARVVLGDARPHGAASHVPTRPGSFETIEDERRRIGRELHDETSQSLAAALLNLDIAEKTVGLRLRDLRAGRRRARHHAPLPRAAPSARLRPAAVDARRLRSRPGGALVRRDASSGIGRARRHRHRQRRGASPAGARDRGLPHRAGSRCPTSSATHTPRARYSTSTRRPSTSRSR